MKHTSHLPNARATCGLISEGNVLLQCTMIFDDLFAYQLNFGFLIFFRPWTTNKLIQLLVNQLPFVTIVLLNLVCKKI